MPYLYELKRIRITRRTGNIVFELYIPDFCVSFGEFVAVVGPSGCGKSTLLDLLAMVARPDEDALSIFNFGCSPAESVIKDVLLLWQKRISNKIAGMRRHCIGYVLQTGGLLPFLTVRQNIELVCRLAADDLLENQVDEIAVALGIDRQLAKKPQHLSGGERQRAAIVRAMIHRPTVVLADEPTAAVDSDRALQILEKFKQLASNNQTAIIMATHNFNLVEKVADRIVTFKLSHSSEDGMQKTLSTLTYR